MQSGNLQEYEKGIAYIFDMIENGTLKVGSKLPPERAIAEEVGVGRNSIREAISILHGMGFIDRVQGSGNYVSKNVGQSIHQTIKIMLALGSVTKEEICVFRRVMEKAVCNMLIDKDIETPLKENISNLLAKMKNVYGKELADVDKQFHDALIVATGNNLWITIMEAVTEIYGEWIDYVIEYIYTPDREKLMLCHENIYNNLLAGEKKQMLAAIDEHYDMIERLLGCGEQH